MWTPLSWWQVYLKLVHAQHRGSPLSNKIRCNAIVTQRKNLHSTASTAHRRKLWSDQRHLGDKAAEFSVRKPMQCPCPKREGGQCDPTCSRSAPFRNNSSNVKIGELVQRLRQEHDSFEDSQDYLVLRPCLNTRARR